MTAEEIRTLYRRPVGTIYRLASTEHWRKCDDRRPALYLADDVADTFDRLSMRAGTGVPAAPG
ncbi:hypothetical protein [Micromonospora sp. MA102]|uniref:hypothetical protein n=1 Tax=Micromonospora sp. MA102 TaxID=2952755 RepID=UPI0021C602B1|nr:hypothetical protein [Micromonospora sp. MA102]